MSESGPRVFHDEAAIVLCGAAGQGIQTIERLLPGLLKQEGYHVCTTKEYMSRVRGGSNATQVRVTSRRRTAYSRAIDLLFPLDAEALPHVEHRLAPATVIIGDRGRIEPRRAIIDVPLRALAEEAGGAIYENVVAVGVVAGIFGVERERGEAFVARFFSGRSDEIVGGNREAFGKGFARGAALVEEGRLRVEIERAADLAGEILVDGQTAVALGALAGGCDFVSAYPMTPATGVFTYLAQRAAEFGLIVEQAEDEIAAINLSLGAWYAGARGFVTTSGGGFALMVEGLSLAGMIESPAVIMLGQRPGPATGLPTRTEQGDLAFALWAGHGEFPRLLLAPGSLEECFTLTAKAFDIAGRIQVPVILLTDQLLMDLQHAVPPFDAAGTPAANHIVETAPDYRRYAPAEDGVSPRGVPGHGHGLVGVDSDEHDEEGHITESMEVRTRMVRKRLRKAELLAREAIPPEIFGPEDFETLLVGWGSTRGAIREALEKSGAARTAFLHVSQVHPLHPEVGRRLAQARRVVAVENNATGQFAALLRMGFGRAADAAILQYDGMPFAVEDLAARIAEEAGA